MKNSLRLLLLVALSAVWAFSADRDWKKYPAIIEVNTTADIYAVGDPHSDADRLTGVLVSAKLMDAQQKWTGGKSVLVITGDTIDKGPSGMKVHSLIRALQASAASQGGQVILTMGNHEAEFLDNPKGKKTEEFAKELKAAGLKPSSVAACEGDYGQFLCNLPIGARVNDWFFSHASNTGGQTIAALSAAIQSGGWKYVVQDNSVLEARLNDKGPAGLPWIYNGDKSTDPKQLLTNYVQQLGVKHLVQGHVPGKVQFLDGVKRNPEDMFQRWGLLFLEDGGMSTGIEGSTSTGGALHITSTSVTAICANGKTKLLWDGTNNPETNAIHCGK